MKKLSFIALGLVAFMGGARAQYSETVVTETVVTQMPVSSVAQVMNMADNAPVIMTGNIVKPLSDTMYLFQDPTGSISVLIDDTDWNGMSVSGTDTVKIRGNVERGTSGIMVDVDYIEKL